MARNVPGGTLRNRNTRSTWVAALVAALVVLAILVAVVTLAKPDTNALTNTTIPDEQKARTPAPEPAGTTPPALLTHFPQFYQCREPGASVLIPTTNVIGTIDYDEAAEKYIATGDARIHFAVAESAPTNGVVVQTVSWEYDAGVQHFALYRQRFLEDSGAVAWDVLRAKSSIDLLPSQSPRNLLLLVATDTRTCEGKVDLEEKYGFSWSDLAARGAHIPIE